MTLRPNGGTILIAEQIIDDPVSELTLMFQKQEGGISKLIIYGNLPLGTNREFIFEADGRLAGAGTSLVPCRPTWLSLVDEVTG